MHSADAVLLYLHIPKAAGTTMSSLLYEQLRNAEGGNSDDGLFCSGVFYHPAGFVKAPDPSYDRIVRNSLARPDLTAVLGHFQFGLHEQLSRPSQYVTVLREPVSRIGSLYHFQRLNESKYGHLNQVRLGEDTDISHFVRNPPYAEVDNGMTRRISGLSPPIGQCNQDMLERAISNLKESFAVVGLSDRFDETVVLMSQVFGWREPPLYYPKNINTERPTGEAPDAKIQALLEERNAFDVELYRVALEIFDEQTARLGTSFPEMIQEYQDRKQAWYEKHRIG